MLGVALAVSGLSLASPSFNDPTNDPVGGVPLLIHAERVIVRPGVELENQDVLIHDGVIVSVGEGLAAPEGAREISGQVVCAGFLDPWSSLGVDAGSARDESTSASTRTVDALDRYGAEQHLEDALRAGVTTVRVQAGGRAVIGGLGAVVRLDPSVDASRAVVLGDASQAASVGLPRAGRQRDIFDRVGEVGRLAGMLEKGRKYDEDWTEYRYELEEWQKAITEKEEELEKDFKKAKKDRDKEIEKAKEKGKEFKEERYKEESKPRRPKFDEDSAAMARVAGGEVPLVVEVHRYEEIRTLLDQTAAFDRLRLVIAGATEAAHHAKELARRNIPVIVWPKPMGPAGDEWDGHDLGLAGALGEAGVEVLIGSGGSDTARELRLLAALAVSHGLEREAALRSISLGAAEAFDVDDRLGSVERGKDADLLVLSGDPLDSTARIQFVISQGRVVVEQ
ncbi:MAG: amidohydrolase family protein [Planctomycetota bacterium]